MIWLGMAMIAIGFALVAPRGGTAGGAARRQVVMYGQQVFTTPGYRDEIPHNAWKLRVAGLVLLVGGFAVTFAVS